MSRHNGSAARPAPSGPRDVRTVVLVGPAGAGKSTLFHAVLGAEPEPERRARGGKESGPQPSTALDVGTVEVPRGGPPGVEAEWARDGEGGPEGDGDGTVRVTVLDTPGRADFVGEVRAGLRAADGVVFVVSAVDGIDSASRMLWRECAALGKPRAVAVTQLESTRADYAGVVEEVRRSFGDARPLLVPMLEDGRLVGLADLLSRTVEGSGAWEDWAEELRGPVIESLIEESEDETLLDRYLEGEEISADQLAGDLEAAVCSGRFFPIVPVHPPTGAGVPQLLALVTRAFPSAADVPLPAVTSPEGEPLELPGADPAGPLVAEVVRTTTDPYVGRLSLVRVFCGTLRSDDKLHVSGHLGRDGHPDHDDDERVGQLLEPRPDGQAARDSAVAGEVVLVTKLAHAETSDTLSSMARP
uniref:GTP-binding protein n=1 Tax=Ornithinicoccus halotolerans TaxID=1748220 RepID=UPI00188635FF